MFNCIAYFLKSALVAADLQLSIKKEMGQTDRAAGPQHYKSFDFLRGFPHERLGPCNAKLLHYQLINMITNQSTDSINSICTCSKCYRALLEPYYVKTHIFGVLK
jgi:hypothetical protein